MEKSYYFQQCVWWSTICNDNVSRKRCPWSDSQLQIRGGIHIIFFLFLHKNICCGCSLEVPQWGASNEYPQHMFSWRNKKDITIFRMKKAPNICWYDWLHDCTCWSHCPHRQYASSSHVDHKLEPLYKMVYFIVSSEISVYLVKIKVVSITSEMISYHFTCDWYDLYFHS